MGGGTSLVYLGGQGDGRRYLSGVLGRTGQWTAVPLVYLGGHGDGYVHLLYLSGVIGRTGR